MSSTFSQELAASPSGLSEPECEPSRSVKSTPIASGCYESAGQMSLFTEMSESLPARRFWPTPMATDANAPALRRDRSQLRERVLMSSAVASPAKISALPERARALAARVAVYGRSTPELLAKYDPDTSSWRTSQLCLDGVLAEFSETWPRSGLMRNGTAYQLPPLVRLTDETGFGLWPTPVARSWKDNGSPAEYRRNEIPLAAQVGGQLNPTWVEWLMGFPLGWTALEPSATPSSRNSRKSSEGRS